MSKEYKDIHPVIRQHNEQAVNFIKAWSTDSCDSFSDFELSCLEGFFKGMVKNVEACRKLQKINRKDAA